MVVLTVTHRRTSHHELQPSQWIHPPLPTPIACECLVQELQLTTRAGAESLFHNDASLIWGWRSAVWRTREEASQVPPAVWAVKLYCVPGVGGSTPYPSDGSSPQTWMHHGHRGRSSAQTHAVRRERIPGIYSSPGTALLFGINTVVFL